MYHSVMVISTIKTKYYCPKCEDTQYKCPCGKNHKARDFKIFIAHCHREYYRDGQEKMSLDRML